MNLIVRVVCSFAMTTLVVVGCTRGCPASESDLKRVRAELPAAMTRLEDSLSRAAGTVVSKQVKEGRTDRFSISFAVDGRMRKAVVSPIDSADPKQPSERVFCSNEKAFFFLRQEPGQSTYALRKLEEPDSEEASVAMNAYLGEFLYAPFGIYGIRMTRLISGPGFRFMDAAIGMEDGETTARIEFVAKDAFVKSGTIWCSPEQGWAISRVDCQVLPGVTHRLTGRVDYDRSDGGLRFPKKVSYSIKGKRPDPILIEYSADKFAVVSTPGRDFTLAHYGLPEIGIPGRDQSRDSSNGWFFIAGLAAVATAISLKFAATRLNRS